MLLDVLQTMLRVNVEGVFIVSRAVLPPHMITQRLAPSPRLRGEGWDEGPSLRCTRARRHGETSRLGGGLTHCASPRRVLPLGWGLLSVLSAECLPTRITPTMTIFRLLTWCCVIVLAVVSLLPAQELADLSLLPTLEMLRTRLPPNSNTSLPMPARRQSRWRDTDGATAACGSSARFGCGPAPWNISGTFRPVGIPRSRIPPPRPLRADPNVPVFN